jgi:hypothetical protein
MRPRTAVSSMPLDMQARVMLWTASYACGQHHVSLRTKSPYPLQEVLAAVEREAGAVQEVVRVVRVDLEALDAPADLLRIRREALDPRRDGDVPGVVARDRELVVRARVREVVQVRPRLPAVERAPDLRVGVAGALVSDGRGCWREYGDVLLVQAGGHDDTGLLGIDRDTTEPIPV